jgi:hypothetical protein
MPAVATFYQMLDNDTRLATTPITLTQNVTVTPAGGEGALVTWMAQRTSAAAATYTVTLNGVVLKTVADTPLTPTAMQEAFDASNVKMGSNVLAFTVVAGAGTLVIGDVMLWIRVDLT